MRKRLDRRLVPLLLAVAVVAGVVAAGAMAGLIPPDGESHAGHEPRQAARDLGRVHPLPLHRREGRQDQLQGRVAKVWPPLLVKAGAKPTVGPGLSAAKLGTIKRPDGGTQVTYNGSRCTGTRRTRRPAT